MMADGLEEIKSLIEQSSDRREFILKLIPELSPGEARRFLEPISRRFQHFDIVGHLPVELVALIFKHLDPQGSFAVQRVSKRWRGLVASESVQKACLAFFYPRDYPPLAGETEGMGVQAKLALRAKHDLAREARMPYAWGLHPLRTGMQPFKAQNQGTRDFYGENYAWTTNAEEDGDDNHSGVRVFNLRDGSHRKLQAQDRSSIRLVRVMSTHVAFISGSGFAYAWRPADGAMQHLRLENSDIESIGGRGRYLCVAWCQRQGKRTVLVWDLYDNKTQSWEMQDITSVGMKASTTSLSISDDGKQLAIVRSLADDLVEVTISDVASGKERSCANHPWSEDAMLLPKFDFKTGSVVADVAVQRPLQGIDETAHAFLGGRLEFGLWHYNGTIMPWISLFPDGPPTRHLVWHRSGSRRLALAILMFPFQDSRVPNDGPYLLFCVASFDRDLELTGGDEALLIDERPRHRYA